MLFLRPEPRYRILLENCKAAYRRVVAVGGEWGHEVQKFGELFPHWSKVVATITLVSVIIYYLYIPGAENVYTASYTFTQSNWSGGTNTAVASHPGDQTGWNKYTSGTNISTAGTTTLSAYTVTDDGTLTTTGGATGGGFSNGTTSSVSVSGSGSTGSMSLSVISSSEVHQMTQLTNSPVSDGNTNVLLRDGSDDYIYHISFTGFGRYSISGGSWTTLNAPTGTMGNGAELLRYSASNTIYLVRGGNTTQFYKYSVSGNSWTPLTSAPGAVTNGGSAVMSADGQSIYVTRGSGSTGFMRYSVTSSSWTSLTAIPGALRDYNAKMFWDGSESYIYILRGSAGSDNVPVNLYRYTIASNSWTTMSSTPSDVGNGGVTRAPNGGDIYITDTGANGNSFYKFSIGSGAWSTLSATESVGFTGSMALRSDSNDDAVYYDVINSGNKIGKYSIANDTITRYTRSSSCGTDQILDWLRNGTDNYMYFIAYQTGGNTRFCVDQINAVTYNTSGNFTSAAIDLGTASTLSSISWTSSTPNGVGSTAIKFQLAGNNDNSTWNYVGPDGTSNTYFSTNGGTSFPSNLNSKRYLRYKAFLTSASSTLTPTLDSVTFGFSAAGGGGSFVAPTVSLATSNYTFVDDGATTVNGPGNGGGFSSGTTVSTTVNGTGTSAGVALTVASNSESHTASTMATMPNALQVDGPSVLRNGTDDTIYVVQGRNDIALMKYSISNNSWTQLANAPGVIGVVNDGAAPKAVWTGDNYIYAAAGSGSTAFYRYSISGNSWSSMTAIPAALGTGAQMSRYGNEDYIYVLRGNATSTLYRYSISGNSWTSLTRMPIGVTVGSAMLRDPGTDYIYVAAGGETPPDNSKFYRYSISGDSWTLMATMPNGSDHNGTLSALVKNAGSNSIWLISAGSYEVDKYSISGNSWTASSSTIAASLGVAAFNAASLVVSSDDSKLYIHTGRFSSNLLRYVPGTNTWTLLNSSFAAPDMIWEPTENYIYAVGDTAMFRDQINTITYKTSGTFTSASLDLGASQMTNFSWTSTTPSGVGSNSIQFQLAANNDNSTWSYVGPDGTSGTYFSNNASSFPSSFLNKRYWRYKAYFTTASSSITPSLNNVTFSYASYARPTSVQTTDDGSLTTTGNSTGGGFGSGSLSNTVTSGAGTSGSVTLSSTLSYEAHIISQLADAPRNMTKNWVWNGTEDYIYSLADYMWRYSISSNSWTQMAQVPGAGGASGGAAMIRNNNEDFIYALTGYPSDTYFSKYSITNNSWTRLTDVPTSAPEPTMVRYGTEDYIYVVPDNASTTFYRYSIAGNSWTTLAPVPNPINLYHRTQTLLRTTGDDYIFYSDPQSVMYRYSISGNSWTTLTQVGNQLIRNGSDDEIYTIQGSSASKPLQKYSVLGNSWVDLASTPAGMNDWSGTILKRYGSSDYIYGISQVTTSLYRYSIAGDSWITLTSTLPFIPLVEDDPPLMSADGNTMYIMARNNPGLIKDTINSNLYYPSGNFTSASIDFGNPSTLTSFSWTSTTPSGVGSNSIKFQIAANNDDSTWNYVGPDGTASTYFTTNGTASFPSSLNGMRYFRYKAFLTTADSTVTPSLNSVTFVHDTYTAQGTLISSIYDAVDTTNIVASIGWDGSLPSGSTIKFQMRTGASTSSIANASWVGPDGTSNSYFTTSSGEDTGSAMRDGSGDRYFQYQLFLASTNFSVTPTLNSVTITYVVNAPPEIRGITATPNSDGTVTISYEIRDPDTNTGTFTPGYVTPSFQYCVNGSSCQTITALSSGGTNNKAVDSSNWTTVTTSWTPSSDFPNQSTSHAEVRLTINDNESANNTAVSTTADFILDSTPPANPAVLVDASESPASLTFVASDTSTLYMRYGLSSAAVAAASYVPYTSTGTISISSITSTVYAQYKDAYGNTTAVVSAPLPTKPTAVAAQDTSNLLTTPADYRIFLAWQRNADVSFGSYKVYRSTDNSSYSLLATVASSTTNFYTDYLADPNTVYYYKIASADTSGNISFASSPIATQANGAQDHGEGGGGTPVAPTVSNVTSTSVGTTVATIVWDTNSLADSTVGFSGTPDDYSTQVNVPSMVNTAASVGQHTVVLSGLSPGTTYYYDVASIDVNNLTTTASSSNYSFTTLSGPVISNLSVTKVYNTQARLRWDTDTPTNGRVIYSTSPAFSVTSTVVSSTLETGHTLTLSGLSPATQYFFYIQSTDGSSVTAEDRNVVNGVNRYYAFNTPSDITGPAVSSITTQSSTTTLGIFWFTDEEATTQVQYGTSTSYGTTTTLDSVLTTEHHVTLSNLLNNTTYHYRIRATDGSGNSTVTGDQTTATLLAADTTPPAITTIATSSVSLTSATITWITDEPTNELVEYGTNSAYSLLAGNAGSFVSTTHSVTLTNLAGNTAYKFRIRSSDFSGNTTVNDNSGDGYGFTTTADVTAPTISSINAQTTTSTLAVYWTTSEIADSKIEYGTTLAYGSSTTLDTTLTIQHSVTATGLSANTMYHYRIITTDASGNTTISADHTATTVALGDSTAPVISNIATSSVTMTSATVTWTTDENANALVEYGTSNTYGSIAGNAISFVSTTHSVTISNLSASTTYYFKVRSSDQYNNLGTDDNSGNGYTFTTARDVTAPTISSISSQVTTSTLGVFWTTNENADSQVEYGLTASYGNTTTLDSTLTVQHNVTISGLADGTVYHYRIRTRDASGNLATSTDRTATTLSNSDSTAPVVTNVTSTNITLSGATITWTTNENANRIVEYGTDTTYGSLAGNAGSFSTSSHSVGITGLTASTTYYYRVRSSDFAGNTTIDDNGGNGYVFTTLRDTTAPVISAVSSQVTTSSLGVFWTTSENADSQIEYGTTASYGSLSTLDSTLTVQHSITVTGLSGNTLYHYRIRTRDAAGNLTTSTDYTATTLNVPDATAPTISNVSSGSISLTGATITWDTNENANGIVEYGTDTSYGLIAGDAGSFNATHHSVTITGLTGNNTYYFRVRSSDFSGNMRVDDNGASGYTFTTAADVTAPIISNISASKTTSTISVAWTTDEIADSQIEYGTTASYGSASVLDSTLTIQHGVSITGLSGNTLYHYRIRTTDASGNVSLSSDRTITTVALGDTTAPTISNIGTNAATLTSIAISWTTNENANALIEYGTTNSYGSTSGNAASFASTTHSVTLTNLSANTTYYFRVRSADSYGNTAVEDNGGSGYTFTTLADNSAPVISGISSQVSTSSLGVFWSTNEIANSQIEYGTTASYGNTTTLDTSLATQHGIAITGLLASTTYHYRIRTTDASGNLTTSTDQTATTLSIADTTAPTISNVASGNVTISASTITWTTNEVANEIVEYGTSTSYGLLAGNAGSFTTSSHSVSLTSLSASTTYYYRIRSSDFSGNTRVDDNGGNGYTFTTLADTTAPTISNISSQVTTSTIGVFWTTNENANSQIEYGTSTSYGSFNTLDSTLTIQHNATVSGLSPSTTYHYRIRTTDASGNLTTSTDHTATTSAVSDSTPPVISSVSSGNIFLTGATISWTTDENANAIVEYSTDTSYGLLAGDAATYNATAHSVDLTGLAASTTYHYRVRSSDFSGNSTLDNNGGVGYTFTTAADVTAPVIANISTARTTSTIDVTWSTNENADSQIEYGTTNSYGSLTTLDPTLTIQHSVSVIGLTPNTLYHYRIRTTDASGNISLSSDRTITTVALSDTTAPVISSIVESNITLTSAVISWSADENSNALVEYGTSVNYGSIAGNPSSFVSTTHSVTLTNLSASTTYYYKVLSYDAFGNAGEADNGGTGYTFTTLADTTAPAISSISSQVTTSTIGVFWTTNENADSQIEYGTTASYGNTTTLDSTLTIQHSVAISGLTDGVTYHYRIRTTDASGNVATSTDRTATTLVIADTTAPTISSVGSSGVTINSATVTWTTSENANKIVEYGTDTTYGSLAGNAGSFTTSTHSVPLTGLSASTTYYYRVRSSDFAGNTRVDDNGGNGYTFTTLADTTAPTISNISSQVTTSTIGVFWTTDENADSQIEYGATASYGSLTTRDTTMTIQHSVTVTGLSGNTTYHYRILTRDASGNLTTSTDRTATTLVINDTTPPVISSVSSGNIFLTGATISWTTNENTNALVEYGTNTSSYGSVAGDASTYNATAHSVDITGLTGNTTYYYRVRSSDFAGNTTVDDNGGAGYSFATAADVTAPTISSISASRTTSTISVAWNTNENADSQIEYGTTNSYGSLTTLDSTLTIQHNVTVTSLSANTLYHYRIRTRDASGNITLSSDQTITTVALGDTTAPAISNIATSNATLSSVIITWTTDENSNALIEYGTSNSYGLTSGNAASFASSTHSVTLTNLSANTTYYFRVRSADQYGNTAVADNGGSGYTFATLADNTAPTISAISSQLTTSSIGVFWSTNESADSQIEYGTTASYGNTTTLDTSLATQHGVAITGLSASTTYHYRIRSRDGSGNLATSTDQTATTLSIADVTAPSISNVASSNVTISAATINWTTSEIANEIVEYGTSTSYGLLAGNAGSFTTSSHSASLTGLSVSTTYYYRIRSSDFSGNTRVDDNGGNGYTFTTLPDTTVPTISNISSQVTTSTIGVFWTTDENADSQIEYGTTASYGTLTTLDSTLTIQHNVTISGLAGNTLYHYRIRTRDASGNLTTSTDRTATTLVVSDTTPPNISGVSTNSIFLTGATVVWTTNENTNALVEYGTNTSSYGSIAGDAATFNATSHSVNVTGLTGSTTYYYRVRSSDFSGNTTVDDNSGAGYSFTTAADSIAPVISSISTSRTTSTISVSWGTNENADSQVEYGLTNSYGSSSALDSTLTNIHDVTIEGLTPSTVYHYRIRSTDASGNVGYSSDRTITTLATSDTTPPTISGVSSSGVTLSAATINWTTDENANGLVEYGTNTSYGSVAGNASSFSSTSHTVNLSGLTGGTTYYYRVISSDISGNSRTEDNNGNGYTFTTPGDTTAPVITNVATSVISDTAATIVWNTNEAATSQVNYGFSTSYGTNSSSNALETTHVISLTGLTPGTTYFYRVQSADALSNNAISDNSGNGFSFTTDIAHEVITIRESASGGGGGASVPLDTTPPTVTQVTISNVTTTGAIISWKTNERSNSLVQFGRTIAYGKLAGDVATKGTDHRVVLEELSPGTTYHFQAMSEDSMGNIGLSQDFILPIPNADGSLTPAPTSTTSTPEVKDDLTKQVEQASPEEIGRIFTALKSNPFLSNLSEESFIKAITELADRIIQPPSIVGPQPEVQIDGTVATVRWATDKNSSSLVLFSEANNYKPKGDHPYDNAATNVDEFSTSHTVILSGLKPGTIYHFQVVSKAILGPESKSFDRQFVTPSELPKITNIAVQRADERSATLSWKTNVPTAATIAYTNETNNERLTQGDTSLLLEHLFTIRNLSTGVNYAATIKVVDEGGNTAESLPIKFTTARDVNAPAISNVNTETTLFPGQNSKVQAVISWDTDEPATSQVFYQEGFNSSSTVSVPIDELFVTRHVSVLTKLKPGTVYRYWVESRDVNGNLARSEIFSVLTAQERETIIDVLVKNFDQVFGWTKHVSF